MANMGVLSDQLNRTLLFFYQIQNVFLEQRKGLRMKTPIKECNQALLVVEGGENIMMFDTKYCLLI